MGRGWLLGAEIKLFLPILDTNILTPQRAFYVDPLLSYRVHRNTETQKDRRTQNFFLLNRV